MSYVTSFDGTRIYYETYGQGKPLLFIHGGGGNTICWYQQVPFFAKKYKVIVMDLRGFKNSPCPVELNHTRHYPADVLALLDHEGIDKVNLVCQSLGAWAGLPLAVKHPERVESLFISGSPTPAYSPQTWQILTNPGEHFDAAGKDLRSKSVGWNRQNVEAHPEMLHLYSCIKALNPAGFTARTMQSDDVKIHPEEFNNYKIPTLMTGGSHDDFLTPDSHHLVAALIPGASKYTFENSGHSPYFESADEFNRVLAEFLKKTID